MVRSCICSWKTIHSCMTLSPFLSVFDMSCKNVLRNISKRYFEELLRAIGGNYPKYLDNRCLNILCKHSQLQSDPRTGMCPGCTLPEALLAPDLASGILIYPQVMVGAAGDRAGEGDPDRALSSQSRTGLFTSREPRFGKI